MRPIHLVVIAALFALPSADVSSLSGEVQAASDIPRAAAGDTVILHYTARVKEGEVFESTRGEAPRGIRLGGHQVLPALESGLHGIAVGEKRRIEIAAVDAFGPYRDEPSMKTRIDRAMLAHNLDLRVGVRLNAAVFEDAKSDRPQHVPVTVIEVTDDYIVVDANHPLAGKDLVFDVEAVDIRPAAR